MYRFVTNNQRFKGKRGQRGGVMMEFALTLPFLAALALGTFTAAVNIDRFLVMLQVARSVAHMIIFRPSP